MFLNCSMNKEKASKLWKIIQEAGDYLRGQLPDHPNHPKGRNPYAHVAICVKDKFQMSYKDIDDNKFDDHLSFPYDATTPEFALIRASITSGHAPVTLSEVNKAI